MTYTEEERQFIKFLEYYSHCYKKAHVIANNKYGKTILPTGKGRNEFEMYALDDICRSCDSFYEDGIPFTPKTTDAIWYGKENGNFYIYLIEFKGDCLFKNSKKCVLIDVYETMIEKSKVYPKEFDEVLKDLKIVMGKFSDKLLNSLAAKPLETVEIALPLIYDEYYQKNKDNDDVSYIDIHEFLDNSRIVYRVVSFSKDEEKNRFKTRGRALRCANKNPSICEIYAKKYDDRQISSSYESSLKTYHKRYEKAGIIYDAEFVDNTSFNKFINDWLK